MEKDKEKNDIQNVVSNEELNELCDKYAERADMAATEEMTGALGNTFIEIELAKVRSLIVSPARDVLSDLQKTIMSTENWKNLDFNAYLQDIRSVIMETGDCPKSIDEAIKDLEQYVSQNREELSVVLSKLDILDKVLNTEFPLVGIRLCESSSYNIINQLKNRQR